MAVNLLDINDTVPIELHKKVTDEVRKFYLKDNKITVPETFTNFIEVSLCLNIDVCKQPRVFYKLKVFFSNSDKNVFNSLFHNKTSNKTWEQKSTITFVFSVILQNYHSQSAAKDCSSYSRRCK